MAIAQLKLLINLARIDGEVADREKKYITTIGLANGISMKQTVPLFELDHEIVVPADLSKDERFNYIFSLVQLMKIDERLYNDEIKYCSEVASRLGYDQSVIFELMLHVRGIMEENELESLKQLTTKYLNPG